MGFARPPSSSTSTPSPHLFVANCGPALDLPLDTIRHAFASFGPLADVQLADATGCRVIVTFHDAAHAQAARAALHGLPCSALGDRVLHIQYSVARPPPKVNEHLPVLSAASETGIPGLFLFENFIAEEVEQELLAAVDERPWQILSKRRVQHYGYEFQYKIRNVDIMQRMGKLPVFTDFIVEKISALPQLIDAKEASVPIDQLTVNEYPAGVGLSPHIDTHSAFEGAIISLSLAGPCIMEFRKYETEADTSVLEDKEEDCQRVMSCFVNGDSDSKHELLLGGGNRRCPIQCRSIFLPERSLLVLLDEARYRWHHYIPHRKVDFVGGRSIQRKQRRVSFTFRKIRHGPCRCNFQDLCDSRASSSCAQSVFSE